MDYEYSGGGLKLKGVSDKIKKKKKSKKDAEKSLKTAATVIKQDVLVAKTDTETNNGDESVGSKSILHKTKAELAYERSIEKRLEEKILKKAELSHKQRVEQFNKHLDSLSEYNDIPKVSWTK